MSSEEVAELAQAIHSHADALYESWTKGPEAIRRMTRMEDTLELLADPGLTPKLEHLVSTFVRRDKAKRQLSANSSSNNTSSNNSNSSSASVSQSNNTNPNSVSQSVISRQQQQHGGSKSSSPPPSQLQSQTQNHSASETVTNIPISLSGTSSAGSGSGSSLNGTLKKPLPKSILAVVQRFESPSLSSSPPLSLSSPSLEISPPFNSPAPEVLLPSSTSSAEPSLRTMTIPGIGNVSRNVLWAESNSRHTVTEKNLSRHMHPNQNQINPNIMEDNNNRNSSRSTSPTGRKIRERHIPIALEDRSSVSVDDRMDSNNRLLNSNISNSNTVLNSLQQQQQPPQTRLLNISKIETTTQSSVNNNNNGNLNGHGHGNVNLSSSGSGIQELEREEERLFQALRTGQIIPPPGHINNSNSGRLLHNNHNLSGSAADSRLSSSSRIAFAKERIRQSQEHPLTQQRLELQKRLPSPSSSLAAAIAVQQGKMKFQSPDDDYHQTHSHNHAHNSSYHSLHTGHSSGHHLHLNGHGKENGRHSWVSSMLRFGGNGASVADRVQLFEKYPAHIVGMGPISTPTASPLASSSGHAVPVPILLAHSSSSGIVNLNSGSLSSGSGTPVNSNSHNVSIVNVSMASKDGPMSPSLTTSMTTTMSPMMGDIVRSHGQLVDSSQSISMPVSSPSLTTATAPWRNIHIEHYQPDIVGSSAKKQKQSFSKTTPPLNSPLNRDRQIPSPVVYPPIPRFYWPEGKRPPVETVQDAIVKAEVAISKFPPFLNFLHLGQILSLIGIPHYWKKPIWDFMGLKSEDLLDSKRFINFYQRLVTDCPDDATRFLCIMSACRKRCSLPSLASASTTSPSNNKRASLPALDEFTFTDFHAVHVCMSDFIPMMQDIIDTHPGLGFLREAPEFHSRYITTVISRIFYKVNRSWTGRITLSELRRSNLLRIIKRLEEETDVNSITEYFSYEHFYVIYCKFWELDKDHDLLIDKKDLHAHGDHALSGRIVERVFDGTVIRGWDVSSPVKFTSGKMTYSDFVWFLLSEEDKKSPTAIEYWFRCLDIDGDGVLSPYELQYFYQEQESRIESFGIEPLDFANIYCQMVDMLRCSPTGIRLADLKRNPQLAATVFNTLFNLDKYLDHEQRDPFAAAASSGSSSEPQEGESDWDKYAAQEYENLIAEESPSDHLHENSDFEDSGVHLYSP